MNLYQKLIEVRKSCPYLKKDNKGFQYPYVSSSQTLGNLRGKMDELGLLLIPRVIQGGQTTSEWTERQSNGQEKRKSEVFTELHMEFTWLNSEAPEETLACSFYAQGVDSGEKGVGKALTYGEKYFLLKFFNIATDKDDPDSFQAKYDASSTENDPPTATVGKQQPSGDNPNPPSKALLNQIMLAGKKAGLDPNEARADAENMTAEAAEQFLEDLKNREG